MSERVFAIVGASFAGVEAAETCEFTAFRTAGMNVNVWDVRDDIQALVRAGWGGATVSPARLADPDVPPGELRP